MRSGQLKIGAIRTGHHPPHQRRPTRRFQRLHRQLHRRQHKHPLPTPPKPGDLLWRYETKDNTVWSPMVEDGVVYMVSGLFSRYLVRVGCFLRRTAVALRNGGQDVFTSDSRRRGLR